MGSRPHGVAVLSTTTDRLLKNIRSDLPGGFREMRTFRQIV